MTKVLIIEDEPLAVQKLARQLKNIDAEMEIIATIDSISESITWLRSNEADLIFLDIQLGDDISFSIFEKIEVKTPIIFTTAFDQYAIKAFKLNSIDYLLKPINKRELATAIEKFHERKLQTQSFDYETLLNSIQKSAAQSYQKRFMVYVGDRVKSIGAEEIACFFAEGKYAYLVTLEGKEHIIDATLEKLEKVLNPELFFRVNRQYTICINAIEEMITYSKGRLKISLVVDIKNEIIVSIEKAPLFKKWLNK